MRITDWPSNERPREKLLSGGAATLSDAELLAVSCAWAWRVKVPLTSPGSC